MQDIISLEMIIIWIIPGQGGGEAQWSETHSDPPKNPKNCVTVPKFTSTES